MYEEKVEDSGHILEYRLCTAHSVISLKNVEEKTRI